MSTPVGVDLSNGPDGLGVLAFRGVDAARFLQGQLSADIEKLAVSASTLAGLHNAQGRVIALLGVVRTSDTELAAVLPRELVPAVAQRLRKYVLRAKVAIEDASDASRVFGCEADATTPAGIPVLPTGSRRLWLVPRERLGEIVAGDATHVLRWRRADVMEGLPQVHAATSETFVAQMLNLDLLGGIAFDKGCYTGQEVIARAHYRGRVKRRLQRWHAAGAQEPKPGDTARAPDGRSLAVVRAAPSDSGWDLLAVGTFAATPAAESTDAPDASAMLVSGPLPLPYSLPE